MTYRYASDGKKVSLLGCGAVCLPDADQTALAAFSTLCAACGRCITVCLAAGRVEEARTVARTLAEMGG